MNNKTIFGILAISLLAASGAFVSPAVAYNSEFVGVCEILTTINPPAIHDGGDIINNTVVGDDKSNTDRNGNPIHYNEISTTDGSYPAAAITSQSTTDSDANIVGSNQKFNLDIVVPAGLRYVFKIVLQPSQTATNTITLTSPDVVGNVPLNSGSNLFNRPTVTYYVGLDSAGKLATVSEPPSTPSESWAGWIYSADKPITINLEGESEGGLLNLNQGKLRVYVVMMPTGSD